jgi:hypothetical protein
MAKTSARVVLNRKALALLDLALADGMGEMAQTIVTEATPHDAPPYGVGLVKAGDWGVWAGGKKVGGTAAKPRAAKIKKSEVVAVGGYGFPARFHEMGTIDTPSFPFLTPSLLRHQSHAGDFIRPSVRRVMGRG